MRASKFGDDWMGLEVSARLHVEGVRMSRAVSMPELTGAMQLDPPMSDRLGEQVQAHWIPIAAASGLGAYAGVLLGRSVGGGMLRGLIGAAAGALGGAALTTLGLTLAAGTKAHAGVGEVPGGGPADPTVRSHERVRVMTWNLHGGMGGPEEFFASQAELDRIAESILREHPDVLVLQEVDRFAARSNYSNVLSELNARLGADSAVGATAKTSVFGRDQDVAVMTFNGFEIENARNIVHPDPRGGGFPLRFSTMVRNLKAAAGEVLGMEWGTGISGYQVRNTIDTMVRTPTGTSVRILSGHYETPNANFDHQTGQIRALATQLNAWQGATIWGGDFNVRADSGSGNRERVIMGEAGMHDTFDDVGIAVADSRRYTVPGDKGIDRIYVSAQVRAVDTHVVYSDWASDHRGVVSELELRPDARSSVTSP